MYPQGTLADDLLVHKLAGDHFLLVVNAANQERDFDWIREQNNFGADARDVSAQYSQLAIQGPEAPSILQELTGIDLGAIGYYRFARGTVDGAECLLARTGYTGEDGFELYFAPANPSVSGTSCWKRGAGRACSPVAWGRATRCGWKPEWLFTGMKLTRRTRRWRPGLGWICKLDKGEFLGRETLLRQKQEGVRRRLVGFEMSEPGIARDGYPVYVEEIEVGHVTSGSPAPFLRTNIGLPTCRQSWRRWDGNPDRDPQTSVLRRASSKTPFYKRKPPGRLVLRPRNWPQKFMTTRSRFAARKRVENTEPRASASGPTSAQT